MLTTLATALYTCDLRQCTNLKELHIYSSLERTHGFADLGNAGLDWAPPFLSQIRTKSIKTVYLAIEPRQGSDDHAAIQALDALDFTARWLPCKVTLNEMRVNQAWH